MKSYNLIKPSSQCTDFSNIRYNAVKKKRKANNLRQIPNENKLTEYTHLLEMYKTWKSNIL